MFGVHRVWRLLVYTYMYMQLCTRLCNDCCVSLFDVIEIYLMNRRATSNKRSVIVSVCVTRWWCSLPEWVNETWVTPYTVYQKADHFYLFAIISASVYTDITIFVVKLRREPEQKLPPTTITDSSSLLVSAFNGRLFWDSVYNWTV